MFLSIMIWFIIGISLGFLIGFIILNPKRIKIIKHNQEIIEKERYLQNNIDTLEKEHKELIEKHKTLKQQINNDLFQWENIKRTIDTDTDLYKQAQIDQANIEIRNIKKEYENYKKEYEEEYLQIINDLTQNIKKLFTETEEINNEINILKSQEDSAVAAAKRREDDRLKKDFYRILVTEEDLREIEQIKSIMSFFRDPVVLCKIIWKTYYQNPTTSMIGRVIGEGQVVGIYKITNVINDMCYIGQSRDISERFKQHVKRGLGAEPATKNKLYPAMKEFGPENFTFELIEQCDAADLDKKEKFWIEYFHAQEFGYNVLKGNG